MNNSNEDYLPVIKCWLGRDWTNNGEKEGINKILVMMRTEKYETVAFIFLLSNYKNTVFICIF